ncbi:MAG: sulfite exporter TauE/SafE family protein [Thermomicrobiales bacterium]
MPFLSPVMLSVSFPSLSPVSIILLILISLIGGIGITAIGPGGILVTIALFAFTDLSPAEVAGTAIVTHIGTGIVGSLAFVRSGQLREPRTRRLALILSLTAIVCTPLGVLVNSRVSSAQFGVMLAIFVSVVGCSVLLREFRGQVTEGAREGAHGIVPQALLGGGVSVLSGVFGIGGPMIAVPIMVITGFPLLTALAAAQVQSVFVASSGMFSYLAQGSISWPLVLITGIPEVIGVWLGWKIAHAVPTRRLKIVLATTLIALGPVLLLTH